jgi:E3 ubiquitin-protein ligase RBX1
MGDAMEVEAGTTAPAAADAKGKAKAGGGSGAGSAAAGPRFEVKKWNAVAMWSWAICTDTCAICRNNLYEPSIEYQVRRSERSERGRGS